MLLLLLEKRNYAGSLRWQREVAVMTLRFRTLDQLQRLVQWCACAIVSFFATIAFPWLSHHTCCLSLLRHTSLLSICHRSCFRRNGLDWFIISELPCRACKQLAALLGEALHGDTGVIVNYVTHLRLSGCSFGMPVLVAQLCMASQHWHVWVWYNLVSCLIIVYEEIMAERSCVVKSAHLMLLD